MTGATPHRTRHGAAEDEYRGTASCYDFALAPVVSHIRRAMCRWVTAHPVRRVLDLGCGTGRQLALLRGQVAGGAWGLDRSPAMLAQAQRAVPGQCVRGDVGQVPFADASFDLVYCQFALHEKPRPVIDALLAEAQRVLAPGGWLLITDYGRPRRRGPLTALYGAAIRLIEWHVGAEHYACYHDWQSRGGLDRVLQEAGWDQIESQEFYGGYIRMATYGPRLLMDDPTDSRV